MANLPLAFAELLVGAILIDAGLRGNTIPNVIKGIAAPASTSTSGGGSDSSYTTTTSTGVAQPASSGGKLTSDQEQFAAQLQADTGLALPVIEGWVLNEESGTAAAGRQADNNNDWLNIGYTDSETYGSSDSIWSDPVTAANATAAWLEGQDSIPGYGTASAGIQSILSSANQSIQQQVSAIQHSGWASGGYPELLDLVEEFVG